MQNGPPFLTLRFSKSRKSLCTCRLGGEKVEKTPIEDMLGSNYGVFPSAGVWLSWSSASAGAPRHRRITEGHSADCYGLPTTVAEERKGKSGKGTELDITNL